MDLKTIARQYAEAITRKDIYRVKNIFAEHVRTFHNGQYVEGIFDVLDHIQKKFNNYGITDPHPHPQSEISLMNIYQDGNTVIVEYQVINVIRLIPQPLSHKLSCQAVEIIKFDYEKIVNIHGYYYDINGINMSEDNVRMHNELKTTS